MTERLAVRWLVRSEQAMPPGAGWLAPAEAAKADTLDFPKRRTEYLLRRLVAKHAVAALTGVAVQPEALARIEVANDTTGAPYARLDGVPVGFDISITDRAGWAVCVTGTGTGIGCDLELVEPRSAGFVHDYLTGAEQAYVAAQPDPGRWDEAANLIWSAKESALKVLRTGLRRDTRTVEVSLDAAPDTSAAGDGWRRLAVRTGSGPALAGWWRRDGEFLLTVAAAGPRPRPVPLPGSQDLALAVPRHSFMDSIG